MIRNLKLKKLYAEAVVKNEFKTNSNIWKELVDLQTSINSFMKKFKIGYQVKTFETEKGAIGKLRQILQQALLGKTPMNPAELQKEIKNKIVEYDGGKPNISDVDVDRVARTEVSTMRELSKLLRWKEMGFNEVRHKTYVTKVSGKKDIDFNNRVFKIEYLLKNQQDRVPLHPNCRCTYSLEG